MIRVVKVCALRSNLCVLPLLFGCSSTESSDVATASQEHSESLVEGEHVILSLSESGLIYHDGRELGIDSVRPLIERKLQGGDLSVVIRTAHASKAGVLVRVIGEARLGGAVRVSVATKAPTGQRAGESL